MCAGVLERGCAGVGCGARRSGDAGVCRSGGVPGVGCGWVRMRVRGVGPVVICNGPRSGAEQRPLVVRNYEQLLQHPQPGPLHEPQHPQVPMIFLLGVAASLGLTVMTP
jgi:hypothetical protein